MTLEDYMDIHRSKTPSQKYKLVLQEISWLESEKYHVGEVRGSHGSEEDVNYYQRGVKAHWDRIKWLSEDIEFALVAREIGVS